MRALVPAFSAVYNQRYETLTEVAAAQPPVRSGLPMTADAVADRCVDSVSSATKLEREGIAGRARAYNLEDADVPQVAPHEHARRDWMREEHPTGDASTRSGARHDALPIVAPSASAPRDRGERNERSEGSDNQASEASAAATPTEDGAPPAASPTSAASFAACNLKATLRDAGASPGGHRFVLTVKNAGMTPIRLVVPGDGSEAGWRTPTLTWTATSGGKRVAPLPQGRCGMMNRIEASEIFTLAPGASRDLADWIAEPSFAKGTYNLRLTYRNDPGLATRGKGGESADVQRLLAGSSACEATSNALRVSL